MLFLLVPVVVSLGSTSFAQPVNIPDPALKAAIEAELGVSDPTPIDMLALTYLRAHHDGIANLSGLEHAANLTRLDLGSNQISDISPLAGLTSLWDLDLGGNQISDISPLAGLTHLFVLHIDGNLFTDISALAGMTDMRDLSLGNDLISDLSPLAGMTRMAMLMVGGNQITDISALASMTDIRELSLQGNQINDISALTGLTGLEWLVLADMQISDMSVISGMPNLWFLLLRDNQISDITELAGMDLRWLIFGDNPISDISVLAGMTNLHDLTLSSNQIFDLSALSGLSNLSWVSINDNPINDLSPLLGMTSFVKLRLLELPLSPEAYCTQLPAIIANNPSADIDYSGNPNPPSGVLASDGVYPDRVQITWDSVCSLQGDTYYRVYRSDTESGVKTALGNDWQLSTVYDDTAAQPGITHYYWVKAETPNSSNKPEETDFSVLDIGTVKAQEISISSTAGGSVTSPGEGSYSYGHGASAPVSATVQTNYHFVNWTGTAVDAGKVANTASANTTVTMDSDYTLIANFLPNLYILGISSSSGGAVSTPGEGSFSYGYGASVGVSATPQANYHFVTWTGTAVIEGKVANATSASTNVTMDGDYTLVANFLLDQHTLTISSSSGGSVSTPGEGIFAYDHGTSVTVVAAPQSYTHFMKWTGAAVTSGRVADVTSASTTVTVDRDYTLIANFASFQADSVAVLESDIGSTSVTLRGQISDDAGDSNCRTYFRYFKKADGFMQGVITEEQVLETIEGAGEFAQYLQGLEPNCVYTYQAIAYNSKGNDTGRYMEFTTKPLALSPLDVLYVDDNAIYDPGPNDLAVSDPNADGSVEHPFDSIQKAIDVAGDHAKVLVKEGRYMECLNFRGRSIDVNGLELSRQEQTPYPIIDANDQGVVVTFDQGEDANCMLTGFVLTRGYGNQAGAIACIGSRPTIRNCLIVGNRCLDTEASRAVIYCEGSHSLFENCTIADNYGGENGAGICVNDCNIVLSKSIVWGNAPEQIRVISGNDPNLLYSCLDSDPLFALPGYWIDTSDPTLAAIEPDAPNAYWLEGDYHLMSQYGRYDPAIRDWVYDEVTSECVGLRDPKEIEGDRINAGAYGGTWMASRPEE